MCVEILNNKSCACAAMDYNKKYSSHHNKQVSYSIRKVLKTIIKKLKSDQIKDNHQVTGKSSIEPLESLKNNRNAESEIESKNEANERINAASSRRPSINSEEHYKEAANYGPGPVHFVCTPNGTFFWTATSPIPADDDLIKQLCCPTEKQVTVAQIPNASWNLS